jgi:hypothetical protein
VVTKSYNGKWALTYWGIISTSLSTFSHQHQLTTRVEKSQIVLIFCRISTYEKFTSLSLTFKTHNSEKVSKVRSLTNCNWLSSSCIAITTVYQTLCIQLNNYIQKPDRRIFNVTIQVPPTIITSSLPQMNWIPSSTVLAFIGT